MQLKEDKCGVIFGYLIVLYYSVHHKNIIITNKIHIQTRKSIVSIIANEIITY